MRGSSVRLGCVCFLRGVSEPTARVPVELGESALVADAAATLAIARRQFRAAVLAGESLGAAVAAAVANSAGVDMLLITPWDRLESVARHHYRWLLPIGALLRDR